PHMGYLVCTRPPAVFISNRRTSSSRLAQIRSYLANAPAIQCSPSLASAPRMKPHVLNFWSDKSQVPLPSRSEKTVLALAHTSHLLSVGGGAGATSLLSLPSLL